MKRLGYTRYVAQGGDWGAPISSAMARQAPAGLLGIHLSLPATVPPDVAAALAGSGPAPAGLSDQERAVFESLRTYAKNGNSAYFAMMTARPQTVGYGTTDSPAGLAGWILVHPGFAQWTYGADPDKSPTKDDVLDDITLYWLTNSATSSARLYWENGGRGSVIVAAAQKTAEISLPVAITVFPEDVYRAPETWARRAYHNLIYFHEVDKGGHFAAWEHPELFAAELRAALGSLRQAATVPDPNSFVVAKASSTASAKRSRAGYARMGCSGARDASLRAMPLRGSRTVLGKPRTPNPTQHGRVQEESTKRFDRDQIGSRDPGDRPHVHP
jgi:pimeloyl-ACP methyl ester carboxylesterase